ncbi:MFS general substrate transporter [Cutaneotrichosporon oleaginosum]|uniref:MFS general substrate transporter n=1 Tax=Cutaneotrichosporon oleaginosum TaxID=879819 RepID=A0A0J0XZT7_9TREE|nr:MFS general substrate transporter [Cutaneotrichosporon oleaginosum]KLT46562.1 MFS general substrate transporter [Cutaneotrichosporon oleaginosum]TXT15073.1 hypothetical protein COLE_01266 [Cutaneotrichosporon oleaginosum]
MGRFASFGDRMASLRIGNTRYNSPMVQVFLIGFVCFLTPGMFNALSNLGAGGAQDVALVDITNSLLYAMFCIVGFFSGSIHNVIGSRLTLLIGACGYPIYVGGLWALQVHHVRPFLMVTGAILGACAGLLWTAQGTIIMAYPLEKDKGRAFGIFWAVFSSGAVVGASIALGIQWKEGDMPNVSTGVYLAFLIMMLVGVVASQLVLPAKNIVRPDGTLVELEDTLSPKEEIREFFRQFKDWRMLALFPMFFASNYFYAYQGAIVPFIFNGRSRALSSLITNLGAVVGGLFVGFLLDLIPAKRRTRAIIGWVIVTIFLAGVWGGGVHFQRLFKRVPNPEDQWRYDYNQGRAPEAYGLLFMYYFTDSLFQGLAYYIMASLSNNPFKLARMTGYYKGVQSAGAAISFGMDAVKTPYLTEQIVSWLLMFCSMPLALLVIRTIKESNYEDEKTVHVEDVPEEKIHVALPAGHHAQHDIETGSDTKFQEELQDRL